MTTPSQPPVAVAPVASANSKADSSAAPTTAEQPSQGKTPTDATTPKRTVMKNSSVTPEGSWEIHCTDSTKTKWVGAMVLTRGTNRGFPGHIDWTAKGGKYDGASGREHVRSIFDPKTRQLTIEGKRLEKSHNISLGNYAAELTEDGNQLVNGRRVGNDAPKNWKWAATRVATSSSPDQ